MTNGKINWFGSFAQGQGYSGSSELIACALERHGVDVRTVGFSKVDDKYLTPSGISIRKKPFNKADIAICYGFPASFSSIQGWKFKIGFTMFETDKLPTGRSWAGLTQNAADSCNLLDLLLVPSEHNRRLFMDSGVTVPIEVVHLGYDTKLYTYINRPQKRRTFTFLQSGNLSIRKNPGAVLSAFMSLFSGKKDAQLIIKTSYKTLGYGWKFPDNVNIKIIDGYMPVNDLMKLYKKSDCFVFPSRGEGFGLPPLEAMGTGLPAIVADNTGMSEYADERYMMVIKKNVKTKIEKKFPEEWGDVGSWYEPDYNELKKYMLYAYENRDEMREMGKRGYEYVKENFTFDKTAQTIVELIKKYYN